MRFPILRPRRCVGVLGVLAVALGASVAAEEVAVPVHECHQGGQVTFSDEPCAGREQTLQVDYSRPDAAQAQQAAAVAGEQEEQAAAVAQAYLLDSEILSLEQQITNQEAERDQRVAALQNQLSQGTAAPDAAAWMAGMNQQITATSDGYNDRILAERARLGQLKAQRAALGGQP